MLDSPAQYCMSIYKLVGHDLSQRLLAQPTALYAHYTATGVMNYLRLVKFCPPTRFDSFESPSKLVCNLSSSG